MSGQQTPPGPPYPPTTAGLGGQATVSTDVPVCSVLLLFYIGSAVGNMFIFQANRRKGHKFVISAALFGFSMARILTLCLRIGVATHPHNVSLAIAANIFVNAGILVVYVVNLVLALRIIRARQPNLGWKQSVRILARVLYALVFVALVLVITFVVLSFYTLSESLKQACRDAQLAALTYLFVFTTVPFFILGLTYSLKPAQDAQTFGTGQMRTKGIIILISTCLCVLNSGFKTGANWESPRPISDPAWYQKKAAFYIFLFVVEIIILYFFIAMRIDRRFFVPNGSSKRKSFADLRLGTGHTGTTNSDKDSEKETGVV
ncbi:hypothetical protein M409DRAFT_70157 [Zasmidium cellare ATCC 36951]|uniref:G-protein coupled receptors family 3 profile domain-containing protein n=1 Tax=Zasmidium cellare ATCC 36951 TaxID=1080233 RepID=A0A6A6C1B9_ZASCE|nr:uncharacterized protein M409DRAFT_70157 [Zasmidium cellare ATCC 36951]KAF2160844.1 hypothetical protein M409DRAFT_70157 [Zasmidium cellare ATCC 36951]